MPANSKAVKKSTDWVTSISQWMDDIAASYGVEPRITITRAQLRGRLRLRADAAVLDAGRVVGSRATLRGEYPNGDATTLEAYLLACVVGLGSELDAQEAIAEALENAGTPPSADSAEG